MSDVTSLDSVRPHLTVPVDGAVITMPLAVLEDFIEGRKQLCDIDKGEDIARAIVKDWLGHIYYE